MAESKALESLDSARLALMHPLLIFDKALLRFFEVVGSVSVLNSESVGVDSINTLDSKSLLDSALVLESIRLDSIKSCIFRISALDSVYCFVAKKGFPLPALSKPQKE